MWVILLLDWTELPTGTDTEKIQPVLYTGIALWYGHGTRCVDAEEGLCSSLFAHKLGDAGVQRCWCPQACPRGQGCQAQVGSALMEADLGCQGLDGFTEGFT